MERVATWSDTAVKSNELLVESRYFKLIPAEID